MNQPTLHIPRPDSAYSVSIAGPMTTKRMDEMLGVFKALMQQSSDPITLYIGSSKGGSLDAFYEVHNIFGFETGGHNQHSRLITVVHGQASSVAAFLGVLGHQAFMERPSQLTFHGARCADYQKGMVLTREAASAVAIRLEAENRKIAKKLAEAIAHRIVQRFLSFKMEPKQKQQNGRNQPMSDLTNFVKLISKRLLSKACREVVHDALKYVELLNDFRNHPRIVNQRDIGNVAENCKAYLAQRFDEHLANNWPIDELTVTEIVSEYFSLLDALAQGRPAVVEKLCRQFGQKILSIRELKKYSNLQLENKERADKYLIKMTMPTFLELWGFIVAFCARLLIGQTTVCAADAHQLGLIDGILEPNCASDKLNPHEG